MKIKDIYSNYDNIIGWGTGSYFEKHYDENSVKLNYLVDGNKEKVGTVKMGFRIDSSDIIKELKGKTLIIIFSSFFKEIAYEIKKINQEIDIIREDQICNVHKVRSFAQYAEDYIMLDLINKLKLKDVKYLEIGVNDPIKINNTFMFHELGYSGVLVEPNPDLTDIIREIRKNDILIAAGAGFGENTSMNYYKFKENSPLNTFSKEYAEKLVEFGIEIDEIVNVPIKNINEIVEENFERYPNVLSIDAEGMDYEILEAYDFKKYKTEMVCVESSVIGNRESKFYDLMKERGYIIWTETVGNTIFLKEGLKWHD